MAAQDLKQVVTVTELDDLLQCPVCYEIPGGHIYQCNQGHHVCGECKSRIDLCPVCRSMFFGTRNYAMEELISNIKKLKMSKIQPQEQSTVAEATSDGTNGSTHSSNTTLGLTDTENTNESPRPAAVMCAGLFRCLCCTNPKKERLPMARMLNHLRYWHSLDLVEGKLESDQYEQAWQIPMDPGRIVLAVRVAELGIYFLVIEIQSVAPPMELHAWLSMVASPIEADNFHYNLTLTGNYREATFSDSVMSVRSCEGQLKKRRRCLILDSANMRAFYDSQIVSVRLCIKRATERRDEVRSEPRAALRIANRSLSDAGSTNSINSPDRLIERNILNNNHIRNEASRELQRTEQAPRNNSAQLERNVGSQRNSSDPVVGSGLLVVEPPTRVIAAPVHNPAQMSRNARRRLRRRLNAAAQDSPQTEPPQVARIGYLITEPVNAARPPVAPQNGNATRQNGGAQATNGSRRSRARR